MKREDAEEFTQSLGQIVGGSWRQIALAKRLGVPQALELSVEQWVNNRLGGYIKMNVEDRRKAIEELKAEGATNRDVAAVLGVSHQTVGRELNGPDGPSAEDDAIATSGPVGPDGPRPLDAYAALTADDKVFSSAQATKTRQLKEKENEEALAKIVDTAVGGLIKGDFREESKHIADDSVDLIFIDPPYDADSIPLYEAAAKIGARILKPGGSMICYTGQTILPSVLPLMAQHLRYWWTAACVHSGGNQIMKKLGVRCGWKPMLWFVKGTRGVVSDVVQDTISGAREKEHHDWQQAESEAEHFISNLCGEEGTVVDFFAGGGTTCVVAERLGRKWIAFEIDARAHERASARILPLREVA